MTAHTDLAPFDLYTVAVSRHRLLTMPEEATELQRNADRHSLGEAVRRLPQRSGTIVALRTGCSTAGRARYRTP